MGNSVPQPRPVATGLRPSARVQRPESAKATMRSTRPGEWGVKTDLQIYLISARVDAAQQRPEYLHSSGDSLHIARLHHLRQPPSVHSYLKYSDAEMGAAHRLGLNPIADHARS